jgi:AraC-like DNA-binding protein
VTRAPLEDPLKFFAVLSGRAVLLTEGIDAPLDLRTGDVGILNNRPWVELRGGPPDEPARAVTVDPEFPSASLVAADTADDVFVGGQIALNRAGESLLLSALPPVCHVRAAAAEKSGLSATVARLFDELTGERVGSAFAIRQYGQLLLLEMLRSCLEQVDLPPGWLRLLTDEQLRPAISRMHTEPGRQWRLEELSQAAAMSRTSFAERFRQAAGVPPLTYLSQWRMTLAQRALRDDDTRIAQLAARLGYGSESAFSTAFKREVGVSPLRYRRHVTFAPGTTGPAART